MAADPQSWLTKYRYCGIKWQEAVLAIPVGGFGYLWICRCMYLPCHSELHKIALGLALQLLFFFLISNQELLDCWVLIQEHRCNGSKACSHPVHNNVLNQCVASTAILE